MSVIRRNATAASPSSALVFTKAKRRASLLATDEEDKFTEAATTAADDSDNKVETKGEESTQNIDDTEVSFSLEVFAIWIRSHISLWLSMDHCTSYIYGFLWSFFALCKKTTQDLRPHLEAANRWVQLRKVVRSVSVFKVLVGLPNPFEGLLQHYYHTLVAHINLTIHQHEHQAKSTNVTDGRTTASDRRVNTYIFSCRTPLPITEDLLIINQTIIRNQWL